MKKNIEWANEEIKKLRDLLNNKRYEEEVDDLTTGILSGLKKALNILDQLDEPETLSAYWIEQKSIDTYVDTLSGEVQVTFRLDDLEKLLVPDIDELIEQCESRLIKPTPWTPNPLDFKSEEAEVKKDIEWLKEEIDKLKIYVNPDAPNNPNDLYGQYVSGVNEAIRQVKMLCGELDEPEVLSQEWIDKNKFEVNGWNEAVHVENLQNLLVPEQEEVEECRVRLIVGFDGGTESYYATDIGDALDFLTDYDARFTVNKEPVIPKFVADWIEEVKPDNSLRLAFAYIAQQKRDNYDDELAFWVEEGNSEDFARAWLDGYTVEEEQKYTVELPSAIEHDDMWPKVALSKLPNGELQVRKTNRGTGLKLHDKYLLTENEIKDYDERFWPFAVKVEEIEK